MHGEKLYQHHTETTIAFATLIHIKFKFWYALLQKVLNPMLYLIINSECLW